MSGYGSSGLSQAQIQDLIDASIGTSSKKIPIFWQGTIGTYGNYAAITVVAVSGTTRANLFLPSDLVTLEEVNIVFVITSGSGSATYDIDFSGNYAAEGESSTANSFSDTSSTYNLPSTDIIYVIDIAGLLSGAAAGDCVGFTLSNNGATTNIRMLVGCGHVSYTS